MPTERFVLSFVANGARVVKRDIDNIGRSALTARKALAFLRSALVIFAAINIARNFVDIADSLTLVQNRLKLVTNTTQELIAVQNSLFEISQKTRSSFENNAEVFARLARSANSLKLTYRELLDVTEALSIASSVFGATTQEARNALIQFSQGLSSGALQGEELRSVSEQLPKLASLIGQEFGIAGGELIKFNKQTPGIFTTERIVRALLESVEDLRGELGETTVTIGQAFVRLNNAVQLFVGGITQASGASKFLAESITSLANNLDRVAAAIVVLGGLVVFNILVSQFVLLGATISSLFGIVVGFGSLMLSAILLPLKAVRLALIVTGTAFRVFGAVTIATSTLLRAGFAASVIFTTRALATLRLAMILGAGVLSGAFVASLKAAVIGLRGLAIATLINPLFLTGVAILAALTIAFFVLREPIEKIIEKLGGLKGIFNSVIDGTTALIFTLIRGFKLLPKALGDLSIQAINKIIQVYTDGVNEVIKILNKIPKVDIAPVTAPLISNQFAGGVQEVIDLFADIQQEIEDSGGSIKFLKGEFEGLADSFKKFTGGFKGIDLSVLDNAAKTEEILKNDESFIDQLKRGFTQFNESMSDGASDIEAAYRNVFDGTLNALTDFVTGAKGSFKELADSIIKDLIRIAIKKLLLDQIVGFIELAIGGGGGTDDASSGLGFFQTLSGVDKGAKGFAFGKGVRFLANGGLLDRPTLFGTSTGLAVGGEAGTEAVLPLQRNSRGQLGVISTGGGGRMVNVVVNVDAKGATSPEQVRIAALEAVGEAAPAIVSAAIQASTTEMIDQFSRRSS